jgi:hypothetical protein
MATPKQPVKVAPVASAPVTAVPVTPAAVAGEQRRLAIETWFRGISLMLVVIALVLYPLYALIFNVAGSTLAEVVAPVTGIAGAIVGYWFGQASRRIQTPSAHQ